MAQLKISQDVFDLLHPIGSLYISTTNTNPKTLFSAFGANSEWTQVNGQYLLAWNSDGGTVGGSWSTDGTALTIDQMPSHNHGSKSLTGSVWNLTGQDANYGPGNSYSGIISPDGDNSYYYPSSKGNSSKGKDGFYINATHEHNYQGKGEEHSHTYCPPFFKVYCWYRTK